MKTATIAATLLALLGACTSSSDWTSPDPHPAGRDAREVGPRQDGPATPHDRLILSRMARELGDLHHDGRTVPLSELRAGLERRHTERPIDWLPPDSAALRPSEIHARAREAVVVFGKRYRCTECTQWHVSCATGVAVTADGVVATACHVLDDEDGAVFAVMTEDGVARPVVEILAADPRTDVALVRVDGPPLVPLAVRAEIAVGEPVWVLSHPARTFWYFSQGIVGRRFLRSMRGGDPIELLDISADFARGSSGGPVLDATGAVVGLVRATRSIYYTEEEDVQRDLQMVLKHCSPARSLLDLSAKGE